MTTSAERLAYQWDIVSDTDGYGVVIEITITKWLHPGEGTVQ